MAKYVIDTNLFIRAQRDSESSEALEAFLSTAAPWIYLHSVVALELLAGSINAALARRTHTHLIEPFERRGRVLTPGHDSWKRAGSALALLLRERKLSPNGIKRSFINDCLIAASSQEHGFTLVTENTADFAAIDKVLPMSFVGPWPSPGTGR